VECVYETLDRNKTTFGGYSTHDEMCMLAVEYYPALYRPFMLCFSSPDKRELYKMFGINITPFNESDPTNTSVILPNGGHKDLSNYLKEDFNFNWTPEKIEQFQNASRDVKHDVMCSSHDSDKKGYNSTKNAKETSGGLDFYVHRGYPNITEPLVVPDVCIEKKGAVAGEKIQDNGETRGNRRALKELWERSAGDKAHKNNLLVLISIWIITALI